MTINEREPAYCEKCGERRPDWSIEDGICEPCREDRTDKATYYDYMKKELEDVYLQDD